MLYQISILESPGLPRFHGVSQGSVEALKQEAQRSARERSESKAESDAEAAHLTVRIQSVIRQVEAVMPLGADLQPTPPRYCLYPLLADVIQSF